MNVTRFKANYRYKPEHDELRSFNEFVENTPDDILEQVFDVVNAESILVWNKPVMWKMIKFADFLRSQKADFFTVDYQAEQKDYGCFYCTNGDVYDFDVPSFKTVKIGRCVCQGEHARPSQFVIDIAEAVRGKGDKGGCVKAASLLPYLRFIGKMAEDGKVSTNFADDQERERWNARTIEQIKLRYAGTQ